jgi:cysteine desulfurase/selenocysteine lyase
MSEGPLFDPRDFIIADGIAPARHGASVCVSSPRAHAIVDAMARRGVLAWNGQGRIRFSFHGYNSRRDVDQAIGALSAEWA